MKSPNVPKVKKKRKKEEKIVSRRSSREALSHGSWGRGFILKVHINTAPDAQTVILLRGPLFLTCTHVKGRGKEIERSGLQSVYTTESDGLRPTIQ